MLGNFHWLMGDQVRGLFWLKACAFNGENTILEFRSPCCALSIGATE